jgi:tetratricopeptide (TPR) repeat protein
MLSRHTIGVLLTVSLAGCMAAEPTVGKARYHKQVQSELDRAVAQAAEGEYVAAAAEFQRLAETLERAGDRPHAAEALFWLGFCREKQGATGRARELYQRVERQYADAPAAEQAARRLRTLSGPAGTAP